MDESIDYITALSHAKINLRLDVLGKREDDYHEIYSIIQALDFCDEISFRRTADESITIKCNRDDIPTGDDNLIAMAFHLLKDRCGFSGGLSIDLNKRIPPGSGLGGGSSNCAVAIRAINDIFLLGLDGGDMMTLGAELGSDVPFFFGTGSSEATGRGEIVKDIELPIDYGVILVIPDIKISTRDVYNTSRIALTKKNGTGRFSIQQNSTGIADLFGLVSNDLEEAVFRICPAVRAVWDVLKACNLNCISMTGSGSTLFVLERLECFDRSLGNVRKRLSGCLIAKARPVRLA